MGNDLNIYGVTNGSFTISSYSFLCGLVVWNDYGCTNGSNLKTKIYISGATQTGLPEETEVTNIKTSFQFFTAPLCQSVCICVQNLLGKQNIRMSYFLCIQHLIFDDQILYSIINVRFEAVWTVLIVNHIYLEHVFYEM